MSRHLFVTLIEGFCRLSGIAQPDLLIRDGAIKVDGVMFSIIHDEEIDASSISIYADLGKLPGKRELEICRALMEANIWLHAARGPIFGISTQTKNITLAERHAIAELTPERLKTILIQLALKEKEWRKENFLNLKPAPARSGKGIFHSLHKHPL